MIRSEVSRAVFSRGPDGISHRSALVSPCLPTARRCAARTAGGRLWAAARAAAVGPQAARVVLQRGCGALRGDLGVLGGAVKAPEKCCEADGSCKDRSLFPI